MASEPIRRDEKEELSKEQHIPRVISMPVGAGTSKVAPMPLPAVSRNPSVACLTKGSLVDDSINAQTVASGAFQLPKKANGQATVADTVESGSSGRWTASEHEAFLAGLKLYGREWKKVAQCIPTRTAAQIRSHAQKYFNKVSKVRQENVALEPARYPSCPADLGLKPDPSTQLKSAVMPVMPRSYNDFYRVISANPASAESKVNSTLQSLHKRKLELESRLRKIKSDEVSTVFTSNLSSTASMGPASAALQVEQQNLRQAAKARYELKRRSRTPSPNSRNVGSKNCPSVSLATMPSSGEFDSGEVLALSLMGGNFIKRDNIQDNLEERPSKSRKTEN
ncbi:hypothetical protein ACHAXN_010803 [Cyclotella atomus]